MKTALVVLSAAALMLVTRCTRKTEPEGYRIVSYEHPGKWVIIRTGTFDGKFLRKRMLVECALYQWGKHEPVTGPEVCNLQVGRLLVVNHPTANSEGKLPGYLDVWEMAPDRLAITEGEGPDQVSQQFVILKNEVMPE